MDQYEINLFIVKIDLIHSLNNLVHLYIFCDEFKNI